MVSKVEDTMQSALQFANRLVSLQRSQATAKTGWQIDWPFYMEGKLH